MTKSKCRMVTRAARWAMLLAAFCKFQCQFKFVGIVLVNRSGFPTGYIVITVSLGTNSEPCTLPVTILP